MSASLWIYLTTFICECQGRNGSHTVQGHFIRLTKERENRIIIVIHIYGKRMKSCLFYLKGAWVSLSDRT